MDDANSPFTVANFGQDTSFPFTLKVSMPAYAGSVDNSISADLPFVDGWIRMLSFASITAFIPAVFPFWVITAASPLYPRTIRVFSFILNVISSPRFGKISSFGIPYCTAASKIVSLSLLYSFTRSPFTLTKMKLFFWSKKFKQIPIGVT